MRYTYAVTFESSTQPPHTVRGEVSASRTSTCARLALKGAISKAKGKRWTSLVLLLDQGDES